MKTIYQNQLNILKHNKKVSKDSPIQKIKPLAAHSLENFNRQTLKLAFFQFDVPAGFPSPAEDYIEQSLDLNELVIKHPAATFLIRVRGDSMQQAGIASEDILVIDRAIEARDKDIILAVLDGEFTVKRMRLHGTHIELVAENALYRPIKITPERDFQVWGVVTYVIHRTR